MSRIPPIPPDKTPPVTIRCAEPSCSATTEVAAAHAPNLSGRWCCRTHYRGVQLKTGST